MATRTQRVPARPRGQLSTITAPPTALPLAKRGPYDNTCGYYDGDPNKPLVLCDQDECNCQTSGTIMGVCPLTPTSTCFFVSYCYEKSYTEDYTSDFSNECDDIDDMDCQNSLGVAVCTEGLQTECAVFTWTDLKVRGYGCGMDFGETVYLSFSHPDTALLSTPGTTSSRSSSSSTRSTRTSTSAAAATSRDSEDSSLSKGAIAGSVIGALAFLAIIIIATVVFFRKRRAADKENDKHVSKVMERHNSNLPPGVAEVAAVERIQETEKAAPPTAHGTQPYPNDSPAMQPLPPSTATSTVVSPVSSPAPSPGPHDSRNLAHQSSHLSMSSFQLPQEGAGHISMPAFPPAPPPQRRPLPDNNPHLSVPRQSQGSSAYSSVYANYPPTLPSFSDPPFMRFNGGTQTSFIGADHGSGSSWFQDGGSAVSAVSEMDAQGGAAQGGASNRQTGVSELMGSVPGSAR